MAHLADPLKGAIDFAKANRIALVRVSAERVTYAVKSWLPKIKAEFVVPESKSLADFLFDGNILDNPTSRSQSKAAALQLGRIGVLGQRLDCLRVLSARGYDVNETELESLRKEIAEEEAALARIRQSEA